MGAQLRLAGPVVAAQLGLMAMGLVDTLFVGHLPAGAGVQVALSATALGNTLFFVVVAFCFGVLAALDPVLSQARGAGDHRGFSLGLQRGFLLALVLTIFASLPLAFAPSLLRLAEQPDEVVPLAAAYARIAIPSMPAFLGFVVLRQALQTLGRLRPVLVVVFAANILNAFLDWMWIHGNLGFESHGVIGASWASTASRWFMFGGLVWIAKPVLWPRLMPLSRDAFRARPFGRLLRLGVPIGLQNELEFTAFAIVAIMMGWIGVREQSAHMLALQVASLTFMVPLGVGVAASVRVGLHVGAGRFADVRRSAAVALSIGVGFMAASALVLWFAPRSIAGLFTADQELVLFTASLLPLAAAFQLFDGAQVVALGLLRGVGDTIVPMAINLVGYWAIGFPVGYHLAFGVGMGAHGLWWGLVAGLASVALLLGWRVHRRFARDLARIDLDRAAPAAPVEPGIGSGPSGGLDLQERPLGTLPRDDGPP